MTENYVNPLCPCSNSVGRYTRLLIFNLNWVWLSQCDECMKLRDCSACVGECECLHCSVMRCVIRCVSAVLCAWVSVCQYIGFCELVVRWSAYFVCKILHWFLPPFDSPGILTVVTSLLSDGGDSGTEILTNPLPAIKLTAECRQMHVFCVGRLGVVGSVTCCFQQWLLSALSFIINASKS